MPMEVPLQRRAGLLAPHFTLIASPKVQQRGAYAHTEWACGQDCRTQARFSPVNWSSFGMPERSAFDSRVRHEIARLGPSEEGQLLCTQLRSASVSFDRSGSPPLRARTSRSTHEDQRLGPSEDGQLLCVQLRSASLRFDRSGRPLLRARTSRSTHEDQRLGPRLRGQERLTQAC